MPTNKIIANYTDPVFEQLKASFEQRSDTFPVAMLPVRLETRFMDETRYVTSTIPGHYDLGKAIQKLSRISFDLKVLHHRAGSFTVAKVLNRLKPIERNYTNTIRHLKRIPEIYADDRNIVEEAFEEASAALGNFPSNSQQIQAKLNAILTKGGELEKALQDIPKASESVYELGYKYLDSLEEIEKEVESIYVSRKATPLDLDQKLNRIEEQVKKIKGYFNEPDFKATRGTIQKISSKISYIKRIHKNSPIKLLNFKNGYTGTRNLKTTEYTLRGIINGLKVRIDEEHVPFLQLHADMKTYPIRKLLYRIYKTYNGLRADNVIGYADYNSLMETKLWLYDELHGIRERAHRPLEGIYADAEDVKNTYVQLEAEVRKFIKKSKRIKPKGRYEQAALTRLETHLIEEYLDDLQDLLPSSKTVEQQAFTSSKVKRTSKSATKTEQSLKRVRDFVKTANGTVDDVLHEVKSVLQEAQLEMKVSTSNTILLPKARQTEIRSTLESLKSHVTNMNARVGIAKMHPVSVQIQDIIADLDYKVQDQQVDVFDQKDRFYDDFKKRITFTLKSETIQELWVRIYPDDIAIDNHDERITEDEEAVAQDYYYEVYSKPESQWEETKIGAWRAAAASLGVRRAAFVIKAMLPPELETNPHTVQQKVNGLESILAELKKYAFDLKLLRLPKTKGLASNEGFAKFINSLPGDLQNALHLDNFTVCLENKTSLDNFLTQIQRVISRLEKERLNVKEGSEEFNQINALLLLANNSANHALEFYKTNLKELNIPFKPEFLFPDIEKKTQSWDRAGITDVLPDRFVVVTKRDNEYKHIVAGYPIAKPLQVSINPSSEEAEQFYHNEDGDLMIPDSIKWMFEFDQAVDAGMAVRIPLDEDDLIEGFETVMAIGVQDSDEEDGQAVLNNLLNNHLYTSGGLEYLPVGTATNNTEQVKSPYKEIDDDYDGAFELFFNKATEYITNNIDNELEITDGQLFKEALGLSEEVANYIRNNTKTDIAEGRAMNRALYNATIKYYMHIMVDDLLNENDKGRTLPFLMEHVSAVGTLPAFAIDGQPYGVLPITPYRDFKIGGSTAKGTEGSYLKNLTVFLNSTRAAFEAFSKKPLHVNSTAYDNDPQNEFIKVLGLEPFSKEFFYRYGSNIASRWNEPDNDVEFPVNWDNVVGEFAPDQVASHYDFLLKQLGVSGTISQTNAIKNSRAYINRYMHANYVNGVLVQDEKLDPGKLAQIIGGDDEADNYINWLLKPETLNAISSFSLDELPKVNIDGVEVPQNTLLMLMLRGGLLYDRSEYATRALERIKGLDVKALERLMASHIDLCTYRLDAWLNGLSNMRLREMRNSSETGTYIGAYGIVENLHPANDNEKATVLPEGLDPKNGDDVYYGADNQGFIHGPSMNHAVTGAVLRAGYNSLKKRGNNNNALAVNLSSARVRKALHLLEGVGNGQEAGALLGYMFERALHEKYTDGNGNPLEMDVYIYRLRRKFPTFGDIDKSGDLEQDESIKAANVVDGLALIEHFEDHLENKDLFDPDKTLADIIIGNYTPTSSFVEYPWGLTNEVPDPDDPPVGSTKELERLKIRAIIHEIDNMADAFDALGDLMTAEGVYQLVRGNHVRASAVLNALADGKRPIDPEIISSMRQGVMVTHRALLNMPVVTTTDSPWPNVTMSPKAKAEPTINHWLATQIGSADQVDWFAKFGETESYMTLEDLDMQAIDLVLMITKGGEEGLAELELRCVNYLLNNGALATDDIELNFNVHSPQANFCLGELVSLLHNLGKTVLQSRAADARDFRISESESNFGETALGIDTDALQTRLSQSLADYELLLDSLSPFETDKMAYSGAETDLAYDKLIELGQWGFSNFYPEKDAKEDVMAMAAKIISAKTKMEENVAFVTDQLAALELELDQTKWLSALTEIANRLYGNGFKMIPQTTITNSVEIREQFDTAHDVGMLRHHSENYLDEWLSTLALVRNRLSAVESVRLLTTVLHDNQEEMAVAQFPPQNADATDLDHWLGAEYPETFEPDGDRLSLVCIGQANVGNTVCALILDEWMEIIPDKKETTGVAMHYNQPDARAPQTILLAVPPERTGQWAFDDLILSVEEALSMAKLRSVEPEHVDFSMFSQLLPATATLAFGYNEMARREDEESDDFSQELGRYVDYTAVNTTLED